jgi:hypothetical protein
LRTEVTSALRGGRGEGSLIDCLSSHRYSGVVGVVALKCLLYWFKLYYILLLWWLFKWLLLVYIRFTSPPNAFVPCSPPKCSPDIRVVINASSQVSPRVGPY